MSPVSALSHPQCHRLVLATILSHLGADVTPKGPPVFPPVSLSTGSRGPAKLSLSWLSLPSVWTPHQGLQDTHCPVLSSSSILVLFLCLQRAKFMSALQPFSLLFPLLERAVTELHVLSFPSLSGLKCHLLRGRPRQPPRVLPLLYCLPSLGRYEDIRWEGMWIIFQFPKRSTKDLPIVSNLLKPRLNEYL